MDPNVDMGLAAEVPDKRRAFEAPVVPDAVVANVPLFVKSQMAGVEASLDFKATQRFVLVRLTERLDEQLQYVESEWVAWAKETVQLAGYTEEWAQQ